MTHTLYEEKVKSLTMIMFIKTSEYYFFLFVLKNTQENMDRQSFIFIRRTIQEMKNLFHNYLWTPLIGDLEEVQMLKSATVLELQYFEAIQDYQFSYEHTQIKLSLMNVVKQSEQPCFVPFIYQEK